MGLEGRLFQAEGIACLKVGRMVCEELGGVQGSMDKLDIKKPLMKLK